MKAVISAPSMIKISLVILSFVSLINCQSKPSAQDVQSSNNYIQLSEDFLQDIKDKKSTTEYVDILSKTTENQLISQLKTDEQKLVFWINIYNAYIQIILAEHPELYEKRTTFFGNPRINIAGREMSFGNIEHGIIRGSQWAYGLGKIRNPFAPGYQRRLRVKSREPRVHFALNCGAKSCPPVAILDIETLDKQLNKLTADYLPSFSSFDQENSTVNTTPLFSWFRGDFGGKKGIKMMLKEFKIIPTTDVKLVFDDYDWSLDLDNFK